MLLATTSRQHSRGALLLLFVLCCCLSASRLATAAATPNCSLWVSQTNNCQDRLRCYTSILSAYEAIPSVAPYCDTGIGLYLSDTSYSGLSSCNIVLGSLNNVPFVEIVSLADTDSPSNSGATTSINCTNKWMHLAFQNPNYEIVLSGINFNTGSGYFAGSLEVQNAIAPIVITNCRFYDNVGTAAGAVTITTNSTVELNDVIFSSNFATGGVGGGIALTLMGGQLGTEVLFNNTVFKHNTASGNGGGFSINGDDSIQVNITSLSASDNKALGGGGGTGFINGGSFTMANADLRTNVAQFGGGALWIQQVNWGLVVNATVHNNSGGLYGGGIFMNNTNVQITNSEIMQNVGQQGGGLYIAQTDSWRQNHTTSNSILDSVVVSGNEATSYGGGIYVDDAVSEWKGVLFKSNTGKAQPGFSQNDNEVYCTPYAQTQYCTRCACSDECASCSAQGCSLLSSGSCVCYVEQSLKDECDNDQLPGNEGHHHRTGRVLAFLFGLGLPLAILAGAAAYYGIRRYRRRTYLSLDTTEGL